MLLLSFEALCLVNEPQTYEDVIVDECMGCRVPRYVGLR